MKKSSVSVNMRYLKQGMQDGWQAESSYDGQNGLVEMERMRGRRKIVAELGTNGESLTCLPWRYETRCGDTASALIVGVLWFEIRIKLMGCW